MLDSNIYINNIGLNTGSDHLLNKPLESLAERFDQSELYADLLCGLGQKDYNNTLNVLEKISNKINLEVNEYEDMILENRLRGLFIEAQKKLNSWESFLLINKT